MITYKKGINVLEMLAACGFTTYKLRKEGVLGEAAIQKLRKGGLPSWRELDYICRITAYRIDEIIEFRDERYVEIE